MEKGSPGESADDLERKLMGGDPDITLAMLAGAVGLSPEVANLFWHTLGFPDADPPGRVFTQQDQDALVRVVRLVTEAGADEEFGVGLIRALGHHMSRLATWQVLSLVEHMTEQAGSGEVGAARAVEFLSDHLEDLDHLVTYAWRRHLASVTKWRLGRIDEDALRLRLSVGFADMAGYTRLSQQMDVVELARLVGRFEAVSANVVLRQGGRVIKTVGDEILFVGDTPVQTIDIALDLAEAMGTDPLMPDVRVGVATGEVVARMGDVYGPTVNLASRLTKHAKPGSVLLDTTTADALVDEVSMQIEDLGQDVLPDFGPVPIRRVRRR